jgi:hypothetical protein
MADDRFKDALSGLSRSLGERMASHPDPVGEAMERRAAIQAEFDRQERQRRWLLGGVAAALASAGVTLLILLLVWPPGTPSAVVATAVAPPPPAPLVVEAMLPAPPELEPVVVEVPPPSSPPPLSRDEVREVQTRLLDFGFDPGPLDGDAGRLTKTAVLKYQEKRALAQTGKPDRALLDQLRRDPAPKVERPPEVAQRGPRPQPARRSSDPFAFLHSADNDLTRWLNSLSR